MANNTDISFNSEAYKIAWDWFRVHADQRMDLFRFYVGISTALAAGFGGAIQIHEHYLAFIVALLGMIVAPTFGFLDYRVSSLLKLAEHALKVEQTRLKLIVQYKEIEIAKHADELATHQFTFSKLFRTIYAVFFLTFLLGAFYVLN